MNWRKVDNDDFIMELDEQISLHVYRPREGALWEWQVSGLGETIKGRCGNEVLAKAVTTHKAEIAIRKRIEGLTALLERITANEEGEG